MHDSVGPGPEEGSYTGAVRLALIRRPGRATAWLTAGLGAGAFAVAVLPSLLSGPEGEVFGYRRFLLAVAGAGLVGAGVWWLTRPGMPSWLRALPDRRTGALPWGAIVRDPVVATAVLAAFVFQVVYGLVGNAPFEIDGYDPIARELAAWWRTPTPGVTLRTPGYPVFLHLHYELGLGKSGVRVTQSLLLTGTLLMAAVLAGDVAGRGAARIAAVVGLLYPSMLTFSATALTEPVSVPLTTAACLAVIAAARHPEHRLALAGLAAALAALGVIVRPGSFVYLAVIALALLLASQPLRARLATAGVIALVVAVVFGPWVGRNLAVIGEPSPLGNGGSFPLALGTHLPIDDDIGAHSAYRRAVRFFAGPVRTGSPPSSRSRSDPWEQLRVNLTERPADFALARTVAQFQMRVWPQEARVQVNGVTRCFRIRS